MRLIRRLPPAPTALRRARHLARPALRLAALALVALAPVGLGGCGGGSSDTSPPVVTNPPGATMSAAELQLAMDALAEINAHRAGKLITPAYTWYATGAQVAYEHCLAMEAGGFFDHTNPNTLSTPASRADAAGITHDPQGFIDPGSGLPFVGENLAYAAGTPSVTYTGAQAVATWVGSPGHHTQIDAPMPVTGAQTMPAWTHCGIGVRVTATQVWYTAMFFRNPTP